MILIGKEFGTYKEYDYFRLYFVSEINEKKGNGVRPLVCKCTRSVYDEILVDQEYASDDLYYDRYGKIIGIR